MNKLIKQLSALLHISKVRGERKDHRPAERRSAWIALLGKYYFFLVNFLIRSLALGIIIAKFEGLLLLSISRM